MSGTYAHFPDRDNSAAGTRRGGPEGRPYISNACVRIFLILIKGSKDPKSAEDFREVRRENQIGKLRHYDLARNASDVGAAAIYRAEMRARTGLIFRS